MKIAILGTRGIPNNYGGFEQFAEYLSVLLVKKNNIVTVYNPHYHPYKKSEYKGVQIKFVYSPEKYMGASANFVYDFLCLRDALKDDYDIILECGYHSNAPSYFLMNGRQKPILITNMDGLEWRRSKWNFFTRWLIKKLEKLAVKKSHYLVSDNVGIQQYYQNKFGVKSYCIAYGANPVYDFSEKVLSQYLLSKDNYYILIARLEPENNIEMILDGYILSRSSLPFIVVGNCKTKYGAYLKKKYQEVNVNFIGAIYHKEVLDSLRYYSKAYFHGHSVGGTNPSLLEAMASKALIIAHSNVFNRAVLKDNAFFFSQDYDVSSIINNLDKCNCDINVKKNNNYELIKNKFSWSIITDQYEKLFEGVIKNKLASKLQK